MNLKELNSFKLSDAVTFHDKLNPKLWNGTKLRPEVREQLLVIAQDFLQELGVHDLDVKDITISGSNAAYSYTKHSDLDLHILVDMGNLPVDEVYRELFTAKKTIYNDTHDIKIHTIPVELYVQDSRQPVVSLGEYSVMNDEWIRIPTKRRSDFDQTATKSKYEKLLSLIEIALKSRKYSKVKHIIDTIKRYRQAGLDKGGEFGPENLAYKMLRSQGYITKLYDLRDKLHSEKLSFETMYQNIDEETNHWYDAGVKDAQRDAKLYPDREVKKLNPRTRSKTMQDKRARHPEEVEQYSLGYRSLKQGVAEGESNDTAISLSKLGKFHSGADALAEFVPERASAQYALHPDKWESTFYSLTNKDSDKLRYYGPKKISIPPGTLVGDMAIANKFYRAKTPEEKQQYAKAYKASLQSYPVDVNQYRMPELLMPRQNVDEAFDTPLPITWEKGMHGDVDALAKLPDGSNLSIMFNKQDNIKPDDKTWMVEFYRNNSQEVTGEGDAQKVFSTVLLAIQQFIKKYKPLKIYFSASKQMDPTINYGPDDVVPNPESRAKLYDRMVLRYAKSWGYKFFRADNGDLVMYQLSRIPKQKSVAEGLKEAAKSNAVTFFRGEPILSPDRLNQLKSSIGKPYPILRKEGSAANIGTYMSPDGKKATSFVQQALAGQGKGGAVTKIEVDPNSFQNGDGGIDEAVIITNIAGLVSDKDPDSKDPLRINDRKQAMLHYLGPGVRKYLNDPLLNNPEFVKRWYNPEFAQKNWNTIKSGKPAVTKPGESQIQEKMMNLLGPLTEKIRRDPEVINYFLTHNPGDWVEYNFRMNSDGSGTKVVDVKYYPPTKQGVGEDYTMQFAAEKTPPVSPYAGVKDNQYRGGISEARRNPERWENRKFDSGKEEMYRWMMDHRQLSDSRWGVSMTMLPKLGINPHPGVSEDTPKGIYFYPIWWLSSWINNREELPWGNDFPYIQLFHYDNSHQMTQQTQVDPTQLKRALSQYCPEEVIDQVSQEGQYDNDPYWFIYNCLIQTSKNDETTIIRWNKVLRDLGFTSVMDDGKGWIAHNEPAQGIILDPRIIKQVKTFGNYNRRKDNQYRGAMSEAADKKISFKIQKGNGKFSTTLTVNNTPAGIYQYDSNTGRSIAEVYPEFKGKGLGKLLVLHAIYTAAKLGLDFQEDESRTSAYDNVLDSLSSNGYIVDDDGYWYVTGDGEQYLKQALNEASGYIPSEKQKNDPRFKTALTVDVHPDSIKKNAKAFYWNTSRAGIPPTAKANGKI